MVEVAGDHVTLWTDYGSCDTGSGLSPGPTATTDDETELLIKNERKSVSRRAVATVVILTAINLLNYTDRSIVAGSDVKFHDFLA